MSASAIDTPITKRWSPTELFSASIIELDIAIFVHCVAFKKDYITLLESVCPVLTGIQTHAHTYLLTLITRNMFYKQQPKNLWLGSLQTQPVEGLSCL